MPLNVGGVFGSNPESPSATFSLVEFETAGFNCGLVAFLISDGKVRTDGMNGGADSDDTAHSGDDSSQLCDVVGSLCIFSGDIMGSAREFRIPYGLKGGLLPKLVE